MRGIGVQPLSQHRKKIITGNPRLPSTWGWILPAFPTDPESERVRRVYRIDPLHSIFSPLFSREGQVENPAKGGVWGHPLSFLPWNGSGASPHRVGKERERERLKNNARSYGGYARRSLRFRTQRSSVINFAHCSGSHARGGLLVNERDRGATPIPA
jgi:hypothetical protein